ncbi:tyrosine-type recombinase/integrase [Lapidilactobacillus bayanensis]|uniref:tyrosine-type recombinase/integrase n=1 Tax=Lapidilactobacillus bayanensis TaxID=2485998 RepID=UPI0021F07C77|nr:tyrosine-type recombinase/integrase [Lapidilactobacillus bayanensis]
MLQNICKNDLYEITIHGFRHTHATLLLEAGVAPKVISERLGHASIQITLNLYAHVTEKMETAVPNIFATVMGTTAIYNNLYNSPQKKNRQTL